MARLKKKSIDNTRTDEFASKILAVVLLAVLIGVFAKFNQGGFLAITGAQVTTVGNTTVNLAGAVSINLDDRHAGFGSGYVNETFTQANISTDGSRAGWVNTSFFNLSGDPMHIINNGTVPANVTIYATNSSTLFIGGTGSAQFFRTAADEASSCVGTLTSGWTNLSIVEAVMCTSMEYIDSKDTLNIFFNLTIPSDAPGGIKTNAVTFSARTAA